jgi:hypothetical protein
MIEAVIHHQGKFSVLLADKKDRLPTFEVNAKLPDKTIYEARRGQARG